MAQARILTVSEIGKVYSQRAYMCRGFRGSGYTPDDVFCDMVFTDGESKYYARIRLGTLSSERGTVWARYHYRLTKNIFVEVSEEYQALDPESGPGQESYFTGRFAHLEPVIATGDQLRIQAIFTEKVSQKGNRYFQLKNVRFK